jgi:hypothetical protein
MLDEMDRSLHDSLCVVKRVLESGAVVPGGGRARLGAGLGVGAAARAWGVSAHVRMGPCAQDCGWDGGHRGGSVPQLGLLEAGGDRDAVRRRATRPRKPTPTPARLAPPPNLSPGGGSVEAGLSIYLENFATTLGSREQLAISEFADVRPREEWTEAGEGLVLCTASGLPSLRPCRAGPRRPRPSASLAPAGHFRGFRVQDLHSLRLEALTELGQSP